MKTIILLFFAIVLYSCNAKIKKNELAGIWKANDGAIIVLNNDKTYIAKQINYFYISDNNNFKNRKIDLSGKWHIGVTGNQERETIELTSNLTYQDFGIIKTYIDKNGLKQSYKINCSFEISGSGLYENKQPYYLFVDIGDPDEMHQYTFKKQ